MALQLGGSDPAALAHCAKLAEQRGYDEINLNVGCPSDRVQNGMFGACLMGQATLVADCIKAMRDVVSIPVTVKTRIGIDDQDSYAFLCDFIQTVAGRGECDMFTIHARKAALRPQPEREPRSAASGLPARLSAEAGFPGADHRHQRRGENAGRGAAASAASGRRDDGARGVPESGHPARVDSELFGAQTAVPDSVAIVEALYPYIERELSNGTYLGHITRHILGLFRGVPGARQWRRHLSENAHKPGADARVVEQALALVRQPRVEMA